MTTVLEATPETPVPDRTYSPADLARLWGVSRQTILNWHRDGVIPRGARIGQAIRWTPADVAAMLAARGG
jgi:predicted DNA-binding transcriptional regulator AlpA